MQVFAGVADCRAAVWDLRSAGHGVGFIPTMGALHEGHLSLIRAARTRGDEAVVSIFVNPTQFGPKEDYKKYPRPIETDLAACRAEGVAVAFTPDVAEMYAPGSVTSVHVAGLTEGLCAAFRPGHFDGVATVVTKLFQIVPAQRAYFGEKDYQQLKVIQRLVADLHIPVEIVGCPTVREPDGLAMSSRNTYLSGENRRRAASLHQALRAAEAAVAGGQTDSAALVRTVRGHLEQAGVTAIQYIEVVDPDDLHPLATIDRGARICIAARLGETRLIDNIAVDAPARRG